MVKTLSHREKYMKFTPFQSDETPLEILLRKNNLLKKDLAKLLGVTKGHISYINIQKVDLNEGRINSLVHRFNFNAETVAEYVISTSLWRCNKSIGGKIPYLTEELFNEIKKELVKCLTKTHF